MTRKGERRLTLPTEQRDFYARCAELLDTQHEFCYRFEKRNRWNHRNPGNGRFPGYGTIRWFAKDRIHVSFHSPAMSKTFSDPEGVYDFLKQLVSRDRT